MSKNLNRCLFVTTIMLFILSACNQPTATDSSSSGLSLSGIVTTLAGSGAHGTDDGIGIAASFYCPAGLATDGSNLYVSDTISNRIRKIVIATGEVTTLAGSGASTLTDGIGTAASFYQPAGLTLVGNNLYVADAMNNRIRKIALSTRVVTTLPGTSYSKPTGITTDGTNLYVTDKVHNRIMKIVIATGVITTLAGSGYFEYLDGTGTSASFLNPYGITTDGTNLYVTDSSGYRIRKIVIATGEVSTLAGSGLESFSDGTGTAASFDYPCEITTDGTNLYVADYGNNRIRKIVIATGEVTTLAGSGSSGSDDGVGTAASFSLPQGITNDGTNLYVADRGSHLIRMIK